jgi:peptidoglycan/xylan/chitin deacetylase (PgdA/CDA1 family)
MNTIKVRLHNIFQHIGFYGVFQYLTRRHPRILVYHRFGPGAGDKKRMGLDTLHKQIDIIKKKCNPISLSHLYKSVTSGEPLPKNAVIITVDDGYEDFFQYAFPLFEAYRIPATLFITSDFVDRTTWLWPDMIDYAVMNTSSQKINLTIGNRSCHYDLNTPEQRHLAWSDLADHALSLTDTSCRSFIKTLAGELKVSLPDIPPEKYSAMSWEQVRIARRAGVEIGSHTCTHPRLTRVDNQQLEDELIRSKKKIEHEIEESVSAFCYPFGRPSDIDPHIKHAVEAAGYRYATSCYYDLDLSLDPYEIKRLPVGDNMSDFIKKVMGWETIKMYLPYRHNAE